MPLSPRDFAQPSVFLANGLGDQLMALPAIRAIGTLFPAGLQFVLGPGNFFFFYRGVPCRGERATAWWADYDAREVDVERTIAGTAACDLFISLSTWVTPSVLELGRRLGARTTVGFYKCFDERVHVDGEMHMFDWLFAVPKHLDAGLSFDAFCEPPVLSSAAESAAERYLDAIQRPGERLLFVHSETRSDKMWPRERFSWVLDRFLRERPEYKVLIAGLGPLHVDIDRTRVVHPQGHLEVVLAILRRTDLFLGIDSCFLHAADLFRLPGVGLFGPTDANKWGFRVSPRGRHVSASSMCQLDRERVLKTLIEAVGAKQAQPLSNLEALGGALPSRTRQ